MEKYIVGAPFESVALDMLGAFRKSDKGNKYLLVVGDYFSKWLEAVPVPDQEATTVAKAFIDRIVSIFGVPCYYIQTKDLILNLHFSRKFAESWVSRKLEPPPTSSIRLHG